MPVCGHFDMLSLCFEYSYSPARLYSLEYTLLLFMFNTVLRVDKSLSQCVAGLQTQEPHIHICFFYSAVSLLLSHYAVI